MRRIYTTVGVLALTLAAGLSAGCGNGQNNNNNNGGNDRGDSSDPCATSATSEVQAIGSVAAGSDAAPNKKVLIDGDPRGRLYEALWIHQEAKRRRESGRLPAVGRRSSTTSPASITQDVGEIAVLEDQGDLVVAANTFDLQNVGLRFAPNGSGYAVTKIAASFRTQLGNAVTLADDDSAQVAIPFSFPFYGTGQTNAYVNSDGNITFGEEDNASTERNVARLLTGAPRVAPFLADLDPSVGGGKVYVRAASDQYTVTWCGVRGYGSARTANVQVTLLPDGSVEMKFGTITVTDAVVGLSPGHTADFTAVDLDTAPTTSGGAVGERFAASSTLDTTAVAQKFYASHPDNHDQLLLWTDQTLIQDAFAYEMTVANAVSGIGVDIFDLSRSFGSAGRLRALVVLDWLGKYPDDPTTKFLGENNTLSVIGQEVGHQWLAFFSFRNHNGVRSAALLGRDLAHWSFFCDSDASVMEGNDIEDQGGGSFKTVDAVKRYSRLDQYAMGLVDASAVPTFFYVENPVSTHARADAPQIGVSFTGTRRDVLIDDILAIHGQRSPSAADSPKTLRQAFIYIVSNGRGLDTAQLGKLERIRSEWQSFFLEATERRMTAMTRLQ